MMISIEHEGTPSSQRLAKAIKEKGREEPDLRAGGTPNQKSESPGSSVEPTFFFDDSVTEKEALARSREIIDETLEEEGAEERRDDFTARVV